MNKKLSIIVAITVLIGILIVTALIIKDSENGNFGAMATAPIMHTGVPHSSDGRRYKE